MSSTVKIVHTVTLPDGFVAKRTTAGRRYSHAVIGRWKGDEGGKPAVLRVLGWSGRLELAAAVAKTQRGYGYLDVEVLAVESVDARTVTTKDPMVKARTDATRCGNRAAAAMRSGDTWRDGYGSARAAAHAALGVLLPREAGGDPARAAIVEKGYRLADRIEWMSRTEGGPLPQYRASYERMLDDQIAELVREARVYFADLEAAAADPVFHNGDASHEASRERKGGRQ